MGATAATAAEAISAAATAEARAAATLLLAATGVRVEASGLEAILEAELADDASDLALLARGHERDGDADAACAAGTAGAVHVGLAVFRRVVVDDVRDVVDVDAAGGDVGRDEHVDLAALEGLEGTLTLRLALAAVHGAGVDADVVEATREAVGAVLGAHEDDRETALLLEGVEQELDLVLALRVHEAVVHLGDGALRRREDRASARRR